MAKWEKKQEYYYVPYQKVEEIVQCLVKGIWEKENGFIDEGKQHLFHYVERIPSDYCECMIEEVIEMTMKRLAVKIGVPMELKGIKTIEWNDQENHMKEWFNAVLLQIKQEISERRLNANYDVIELSKQYIEKNYSKNISLKCVAKEVGLNPSYFSQLFKLKTGETFVQYRSRIRINKAMDLLFSPEKTVTEVALDVGYHDITHFIRMFKKYTGYSPTAFRKIKGIGQ